MVFEFIVEWGYKHIYFENEFLPSLNFDGQINIKNGKLVNVNRMIFQKDNVGTHVLTPQFAVYGKQSWESTVCNCFDGFLFSVEGSEKTVVHIKTNSAKATFSIEELLHNEHLVYDTDNPFLFAVMHVYLKNHEWYLAKQKDNELRIYGKDFTGKHNTFFGVNGVVVPCGEKVESTFNVDSIESLLRVSSTIRISGAIRVMQNGSETADVCAEGVANYKVKINGKVVYTNDKYSYRWDDHSTHLEENFFDIPTNCLNKGENIVEIDNNGKEIVVLVQMLRIFIQPLQHLDVLRCPKWVVTGKPFSIKIYTETPTPLSIICTDARVVSPSGKYCMVNNPLQIWSNVGENEYFFIADAVKANLQVVFRDLHSGKENVVKIAQVWTRTIEEFEPKTGIEIKIDQPQDYQRYLDKLIDDQMGNYVMFRLYHYAPPMSELWEVATKCKKYGVYTDVITLIDSRALVDTIVDGAGEYNFAVGSHESTGIFYWGNLFDNPTITTMDEAEKASVSELKSIKNNLKVGNANIAMGDASGGARFAYQAGFDILRHETYCAHHLTLLPIARGSARAYNKPIWGAHVASQHNFQNELDTALGRFWLSMFMPWVFGANFVFEEDSLFQNNKYYRMVNDDYITIGKQKITAEYFKHIQTHGRLGSPQVNIAFIQGRHEAPFTSISACSAGLEMKYKKSDARIWGKNGSPKKEWGHRQPEKGWHLLEMVAPQIYLQPLSQDPYKTRKVFSGNPYGEFDFLPIEAPQDIYSQYKILFMLGWNTMCETVDGLDGESKNDYERLKCYVERGGVLVLSVPQLSKRTDRELLNDMEHADLYNSGDVSDLFGVYIGTPCEEISGAVDLTGNSVDYNVNNNLIRMPSEFVDEDGECRLADIHLKGAEVIIADKDTEKPLLIRNSLGKGYAYLLCVYAYPGHEKLKYISTNIMQNLLEKHLRKDVFVYDENQYVYWSNWEHANGGRLYLLNTDWTKIGNEKRVKVDIYNNSFDCVVRERHILEIAYHKESAIYSHHKDVNIQASENGGYLLCGFGTFDLFIFSQDTQAIYLNEEKIATVKNGKVIATVTLNGQANLFLK